MTIFGKVLLGLILATAAVLLIKGVKNSPDEEVLENPEVVTETSDETPAPTPTDTEEFKGSMKTLIARGGNYKCMFKQDTDAGTSTGTVYISDKEMRGDFTSIVAANNMTVESHMISDGEFMYTWSPMMPTGMKIAIDASATESASQGFDTNAELEYK